MNKDYPWYGSTNAAPLSDGTAVYAVAAPDAVVCYEFDGRLRWAADMEAGARRKVNPIVVDIHMNIAAPVLSGTTLIYMNTNVVRVYAYDCATGHERWQVGLPGVVKNSLYTVKMVPKNYAGHMGPGGTPVPMVLRDGKTGEDVPVVVLACGDVLRVSDGAHLGAVDVSRQDSEVSGCSGIYGTSVAVGDCYYSVTGTAFRLALAGGTLAATKLWELPEDTNKFRGTTPLIASEQGLVTWGGLLVDYQSGQYLPDRMVRRGTHRYITGFATLDGMVVTRADSDQIAADIKDKDRNIGLAIAICPLEGLKSGRPSGVGFIVEGRQPDSVRQTGIDVFGKSRWHMGWAHPSGYGNRLFVRTSAYLYCFGKGEWKPPY
jgi:hypothetical protein